MAEHSAPIQWLRYLFYIHIALLGATFVSWLPIPDLWLTWLKRVLMIGAALCLARLSPINSHYKKAALFSILRVACLLISSLLFSSFVIALAGSILSILAVYQEYHAHSQLVAEWDETLSQKWERFFGWALLVEILVSFLSSVVSVVMALMNWDVSNITTLVVAVQLVPSLFIEGFYLMYLNRTVRLLNEKEGDFYG